MSAIPTTTTNDPPPAEAPPAAAEIQITGEGGALVAAAGLRSSRFSFGHLDGMTWQGLVHDPEVRSAWTAAGQAAAEAVRREAGAARDRALGEHDETVALVRKQLAAGRPRGGGLVVRPPRGWHLSRQRERPSRGWPGCWPAALAEEFYRHGREGDPP